MDILVEEMRFMRICLQVDKWIFLHDFYSTTLQVCTHSKAHFMPNILACHTSRKSINLSENQTNKATKWLFLEARF
jgi:hypothetical protein